MDLAAKLTAHFEDNIAATQRSMQTLSAPLLRAIDLCFGCVTNNAKMLACGNGGSAADAQHFIAELVGRFERERLPLAGVALNTDTSILTAVGNDYGYDQVFARQVMALGQPGDVLVAISTSGNSVNVQLAIQAAHAREMKVIALTGKGGGTMSHLLQADDVHLCVPHDRTMRIQEVHILLLHMLCDGIDTLLLGDPA
jgi:D-sedoheptulose 7-phosphate isomerase